MAGKRYLVAHRGGPRLSGDAARRLDATVAGDEHGKLLRTTPAGRRVVALSERSAQALADSHPDVIVEEDKPIKLFRMPGLPPMVPAAAGPALSVRAMAPDGRPIPDCTVYALGAGVGYRAVTGPDGVAILDAVPPEVDRVVVSPRDSFWSAIVENVARRDSAQLDVALSPLDAGAVAAWFHRLLGVDRVAPFLRGRGVSVAVIDTGIAPANGALRPVGGLNTLDGADPARWDVDEKGHGTHCAGIIAALPPDGAGPRGIAPGVALYSLKVFPGGFVSDLVEAVEWCTMHRIDLVNMSLGNPEPSAVLAAALADAHGRGVTVVAATGNESTHVAYPAALPTVIGVGAIGRFGSFPESSAHVLKVGRYRDWWGGLFDGSFSNFGPEVNLCAPGVAIASTVPTGYAAWDGTSMACPIVTALAALALEACPWLRTGDAFQPEALRRILASAALDLGLPESVQGAGLPTAPRILAVGGGSTARW